MELNEVQQAKFESYKATRDTTPASWYKYGMFVWMAISLIVLVFLVSCSSPAEAFREGAEVIYDHNYGSVKKVQDGEVTCYLYKEGRDGAISCIK